MKPIAPQMLDILALLVRRGNVNGEQIAGALWDHLPECQVPEGTIEVVRAQVCKLRRRMAALGIEITTSGTWGVRYYMDAHNREKAQFLLDNYWALVFVPDNQLELFIHGLRKRPLATARGLRDAGQQNAVRRDDPRNDRP